MLNQPLILGRVTLPNRIVSAPMERNYCTPEGYLTPVYHDYLMQRAKAGVGLVFTEATFVRADGRGRTHQLGMHRDECISGVAALAEEMHAAGSLLGMELNHGGRTAQQLITGFPSIAPSPDACAIAGGELPRAMSTDEVIELAEEFGRAAARCVTAGVDVIEIHGGHGYLIHQFMSPLYNKRDDRFGDRGAFLSLVIERVRANAPELTIGLRVSVVEGVDGGLTAPQQHDIIATTRLDLLDYLDISAGSYESGEWIIQSGEWAPGFLSEYAQLYRGLGLPLGMAGRLNSPEAAAAAISDGVTDFVTIGRALHADPQWAAAALGGGDYRPCIACNVCIDGLGEGPVLCTVNPTVGRGRIMLPLPRVVARRRVAVVGSGPAGLSTAVTLSQQGVDVTVIEQRDRLGGQFELAARQQSNPEYARYLRWAEREFARLGTTVLLDTVADDALLAGLGSDAIVLATGNEGTLPAIPGHEADHVFELRRWLIDNEALPLPKAVTLWGADGPAMSVADSLASQGVEVLIVGGQPAIAPELGRRSKILVHPRLAANPKVRLLLGTVVQAIEPGRLLVADADGSHWLDAPGIVLASQGAQARERTVTVEAPVGTIVIGDATGSPASSIRKAIVAGTEAATELLGRFTIEAAA